jgi:putative DNA primase/helicase
MGDTVDVRRGSPDQEKRQRAKARERTETTEELQRTERAARTLMAVADERLGPAFDLNDMGNILRFRAVWGDEVRWCPNERGGGAFWWFDDHRWVEDRTNEVHARVWAVLRAMENERDAVIDRMTGPDEDAVKQRKEAFRSWVARSLSVNGHRRILDGLRGQLGMDPRSFDGPSTDEWLNTPSVNVSLRYGKGSSKLEPWNLVTHSTEVPWIPHATCPRFLAALDTWMCGRSDLVLYLQKLLGASLLPGAVGRQLVVLVGPLGANGKTTLGEIMRQVLGDYAGTLSADALMAHRNRATHDEILAPLLGRRFVFASEGSEHLHWNTTLVKLLTGGDTVSVRRIFSRQEAARATWSIVVASNSVPRLGNVEPAIRDRLRLIPFDHHVPREERDDHLVQRLLDDEGSGILNWLLEGLGMVLADGIGDPPEAVKALTEDYFETVDEVGRYIAERIVRYPGDPTRFVGGGALHADYRAWCAEEGLEPVSLTRLGSRLNEAGIAKGRDTGNRIVRLGISLRSLEPIE